MTAYRKMETEFRRKDIARSSFHWYVEKIRFTSSTIIDCQIKSIWPLLWNVFQNDLHYMVKNVHYSRTPTTINCHMLLRRLKRLSQFWTKKGTKCPSGMTKIFWKVTSPNIKTIAFGSKQKNKKVKILRTEVACEQALLGLPGIRRSGREEANESLHSRLVSLNIYVPEQGAKCWWATF